MPRAQVAWDRADKKFHSFRFQITTDNATDAVIKFNHSSSMEVVEMTFGHGTLPCKI